MIACAANGLYTQGRSVASPPATNGVKGLIVWSDTGEPVTGALVTLKSGFSDIERQTTDISGLYEFAYVPAESVLEVALVRRVPYGIAVDRSQEFRADPSVQKISLPRPKHVLSLKGEVHLPRQTEGIEVQIRSSSSNLKVGQSTFTDSSGGFQFFDLENGKYDLQVLAIAKHVVMKAIEIPRRELLRITNDMSENASQPKNNTRR
jgi:hypothetical protein